MSVVIIIIAKVMIYLVIYYLLYHSGLIPTIFSDYDLKT